MENGIINNNSELQCNTDLELTCSSSDTTYFYMNIHQIVTVLTETVQRKYLSQVTIHLFIILDQMS